MYTYTPLGATELVPSQKRALKHCNCLQTLPEDTAFMNASPRTASSDIKNRIAGVTGRHSVMGLENKGEEIFQNIEQKEEKDSPRSLRAG